MYNKKSDALLLFLAEFRSGLSAEWMNDPDYYKTQIYTQYLGNLKKVMQGLVKDGQLRRMTAAEILDMDHKVTDLKEECKKRGLKVSGKKAELITRILEADPDLLKACEKRDDLWICTTIGLSAVYDFYKQQDRIEKNLQDQVFGYLSERKFSEAAKAVAEVRNNRVFPDWFGIGSGSEITLSQQQKEVEIIYNETPKALKKVDKVLLERARGLISWDILRGTNSFRKYENEPTNINDLTTADVMQEFMIYASGKLQLEQWQKVRYAKGVRIEPLYHADLCPECQKLIGKVYDKKKVPVIPNEKCLNTAPCPLCYVVEHEEKPKKKLFGLF